MTLLAIGGLDHNGSVTLIDDEGEVWFLELERSSRMKNIGVDHVTPLDAVLDRLQVTEVERIGVADRTLWQTRKSWLEPYLRQKFSNVVIKDWPHHDCHAASALVSSPWEDALVITVDGKGDGRDLSSADGLHRERREYVTPSCGYLETNRTPACSYQHVTEHTWRAVSAHCPRCCYNVQGAWCWIVGGRWSGI